MKVNLYATPNDMLQLLDELESKHSIGYFLAGSSDEPRVERWISCRCIPGLGVADGPQTSLCKSYLITEATDILPRKVVQFTGKPLFFADQLINPDSVVLTPAGIWRPGIIVAGSIGTAHTAATSRGLVGAIGRSLRRTFTKVKSFWIGPEAFEKLHSGWRLTIAEQSPSDFDLQIE